MFKSTAALTAEIARLRTDLRKVQSFAASAGQTITPRDACEVIRSICVSSLTGEPRASAIVSHVDRVAAALGVSRG